MASYYTEYYSKFETGANKQGFYYSIPETLGLIPSMLAHTIDTFLYLDGTLGGDPENYYHGPLGALVGYPTLLLGKLAGAILQLAFSLPSYLAHYLIDKPLSWFMPNFDRLFIEYNEFGAIAGLLFSRPTGSPLPTPMQGLAGFIVGLVPELLRYLANRIITTVNCVLRMTVDTLCDGIRAIDQLFYSMLLSPFKTVPAFPPGSGMGGSNEYQELSGKPDPTKEDPSAEPAPKKKTNRRRRLITEDSIGKEVKDAVEKRIDYFALLDMEAPSGTNAVIDTDDVNKKFRKKVMSAHPDKGGDPEVWKLIDEGRKILLDPIKGRDYLKLYQSTGFFAAKIQAGQGLNAPSSGPLGAQIKPDQPEGKKPRRKLNLQ